MHPRSARPDSVWTAPSPSSTATGSIYKMYEYNTFDPLSGHHSITATQSTFEPPTKRRKLCDRPSPQPTASEFNGVPQSSSDRFSLCSLGFQPLAARAIIEELESQPKLRYSDEFRRDVARSMQCESTQLALKLSVGAPSIQRVFPTSNGRDGRYVLKDYDFAIFPH